MDEKELNRSFYELVKKVRTGQKHYFSICDIPSSKEYLDKELKPLEQEVYKRLADEHPTLKSALDFRECVKRMRYWQCAYFRMFDGDSLTKAKNWEKQVDRWILLTEDRIKAAMSPKLQFED